MKREAILKTILVLIVGVVLLARPVNVFAVSSNPTDLNDFWEDQGSIGDIQQDSKPTTPEQTTPSTPTTQETPKTETKPNTQTNTNTNTTNKNDIPKAGLVEDTVMVVTILAFIVVAVFAFVKISDYSNI